ncbi:MAG TPA: Sec-independent protein translocase protein TatB [Caulobacteraceae bacterium]|jgi:sec-independent protein translocase protein TatB
MFPEGRLFEFVILGAVALIVVGPKDLPVLMRKVGQFMARVRGMAAEFRASFDELARQSELDELRREVQSLRETRPLDYAARHLGAADMITDIKTDLTETSAELAEHTGSVAETPPAPLPEPEPPAAADEAAPDAGPKAAAS